MRRFEFVGGTSSKFWQIDQQDRELHVGWGRIGSNGQHNIKTFANAETAAKTLDKLVRRKLAEGYVEKGGATPKRKAAPRKPERADVTRLLALCSKSIKTLQTSELVTTKVGKTKPVAEAKLRAWETKENVTLPADYVAFLVAHGPLELEWQFRTDDGATYDFGGHQLSVRMPTFNQYRHEPEFAEDMDRAYFASEDQNNYSWAFRLRPEPVKLVRTDENGFEFHGSFTDWLTEIMTFFGLKSEFPKAARNVRPGQLADLAVLRTSIQISPPTLAKKTVKRG